MRFQTEDSDGVVTQKTVISVTPAVTTLNGAFRITLCPSFGPSGCLSGCQHDKTVIIQFITGVVSHDADYRKIFSGYSRLCVLDVWIVILLVQGSFVHGNELSASVNGRKFLYHLNNRQFFGIVLYGITDEAYCGM